MARRPAAPSLPEPERTMPIAASRGVRGERAEEGVDRGVARRDGVLRRSRRDRGRGRVRRRSRRRCPASTTPVSASRRACPRAVEDAVGHARALGIEVEDDNQRDAGVRRALPGGPRSPRCPPPTRRRRRWGRARPARARPWAASGSAPIGISLESMRSSARSPDPPAAASSLLHPDESGIRQGLKWATRPCVRDPGGGRTGGAGDRRDVNQGDASRRRGDTCIEWPGKYHPAAGIFRAAAGKMHGTAGELHRTAGNTIRQPEVSGRRPGNYIRQ